MFIKFSDKTKNIMVKKSRKEPEADGYIDDECIFLDDDSKKDRRIKVLSEAKDDDSGEDK